MYMYTLKVHLSVDQKLAPFARSADSAFFTSLFKQVFLVGIPLTLVNHKCRVSKRKHMHPDNLETA